GSLSDITYDIENAYVLVRDAWTESAWASTGAGLTPKYVRLRGNTIFTLHNFFQDLPRDINSENVNILVDNINGKASFIGGILSASTLADVPEDQHSYDSFVDIGDPEFESTPAVIVQGDNPLMKTAVIASTGEGKILFQNKASAGEVGQVYLSTFSPDIKLLDDWGKTDDDFLLEMFEQTRNYGPISSASTASGFSDVYLHRIFVNGADTGMTFTPSYCGNKIKEGNEQCDDGKVSEFCAYGKTSACQVCVDCTGYAPGKTTYCGDKICDIKYESTTSCQQDCGLACPTNNLVSWWPADNNAEDLISKNHGELKGDATYAAGMVGNSFSFDGDKDFVFVGDPFDGSLDFGSDDFTISFWGRSNGDGFFVAKGCSSCTNGLGYDVDIADGGKNIIYRINGGPSGGGIIAGANINNADLKQWHHYAGVYNRKGLLEMYLDGQPAGTIDISGESGSIDNTAPFLIGALQSPTGAGSINGQIDEVAVWRKALSV
ncbi:MAG: LamG domain-containing protein, partial [Nanoarchaeota archaeon]